jgi:hypothetical protein
MLVDTICPLCDHPGSVEDPYKELQRIVLRSYGLSEYQKIVQWLDHPGLGVNKPSVLLDQLNTLQPPSIVEVQKVLFLRKMPTYIRDMINLKNYHHRPMQSDLGEQKPGPGRHRQCRNNPVAALPGLRQSPQLIAILRQVANTRSSPGRLRRQLLFLPLQIPHLHCRRLLRVHLLTPPPRYRTYVRHRYVYP